MRYDVDSGNLQIVMDGAEINAVIGEYARIDVPEALNYIKTGTVEIEGAVQEGLTEFNNNATSKTNDFNTNASNKTTDFNTNASNKTSSFNENYTEKLSSFNSNATDKTNTFNQNATDKTTAFNNNATSKTTDFNTNATNKTTDFNNNYAEKKALIDAEVQTAKDWATKTDGTVDGTDYSAKYYAQSILPIATEITTVAGISSQVTTVAGISSDVTTVANISGDVTAVKNNSTNISAVADDLTNIDSVAANITNINAVNANKTNIDAVAANETNINAVNANKTNIDTVAGDKSNIDTVAGISSEVSTVAGIASDVSAVENIASDVTTVAGIASDVTAVKNNATDISAVAGDITNINSVAGDLTNINAVNSNKTNIDAVAGNETNINSVAGNATNINNVAADLTNINAVAADLTNINNASSYAAEAKQWAIGDPTEPSDGSAKYWAGQAAAGQVQSNWTEADTSSKAYIKNKPTAGTGISLASNQISVDADASPTQNSVKPVQSGGVYTSVNNLQSQIDAIVASSDVFDIVGTYAELQAYDISTVPVNDIIKVLVDSTHDNAATYYRCVSVGGVKSWSYIGSEGAYYTKAETNTLLGAKQNTITGAATTITSNNLTASRTLVSDANGKVDVSNVTSTELGYVSGVTSAIQTQINAKQATITGGATSIVSSNLTSSKALVSDANGKVAASSVTSTELGYVSGVTSSIQTQLGNKQETLVSGTNIKTINNTSLLGSGNISINPAPSIDNKSITTNSSNQLQTVGVINSRDSSTAIKTWTGTKAQYDALKTAHTMYEWVNGSDKAYTANRFATVGDSVYNSSYELIGTVSYEEYSPPDQTIYIGESGPDQLVFGRLDSDTSTVTIYEFDGDANTLYNITDDSDVTLTVLEALYPVGSIYITTANGCPLSTLISGSTWVLVSSGRVLQGADSGHNAGTTIEAGLPNITGCTGMRNNGLASTTTGAFWIDTSSPSGSYANDGYYAGGQSVSINASRSSSIYGNSSTVQPPAYCVNIYRRTA